MNAPHTEALILAAGKGSRVGPLPFHKSLLPTKGGKPILSYGLKALYSSGFNGKHISVMVGHKQESVRAFIAGDTNIREQKDLNGTGGALQAVLEDLPEDTSRIIVMNGDDSLSYNAEALQEMLLAHDNAKAKVTISVTDHYNPNVHNHVYLRGQDQKIIQIADAISEKGYYLTGLCVMEVEYVKNAISTLLSTHDASKEFGITSIYQHALTTGSLIRALVNTKASIGINTLADWRRSLLT